jgi:flagellar hook-associated protein 1 FlgK
LADTSVDSDGYLVGSLQQVNIGAGPSQILSTSNGNIGVSTGPVVESITRLRNSFLDSQIQNESSVLGETEILSNSQSSGILDEINQIVNGPTTINSALTTFAAAWASLASDPSNTGLRAAVVNAGVAFAQLSNSQFNQLGTLQQGNSEQINNTVSQINQFLQQISSINQQLLNSQGAANVNSLLDARDYALDRLSRLINIQTNINGDGTVSVYLGGSSVALVEPAGAAILQTNVSNPNYPSLIGVTIQTPEGGFYDAASANGTLTPEDMSQWITGGNLGGELQGQNAILSYQNQVDQIATSVMTVTNDLEEAGYGGTAATANSTGTPFFTGTGAIDISVNAALITDATHALLGVSNIEGSTTDGQVAAFLGNLPNILANNFIESNPQVNLGGTVDPGQPIATQPFAVAPSGGQFMVNGVAITYTTANSIDDILNMINTQVPNVYAVFNATTQEFYMFSNNPITVTEVGGDNFISWGNIKNVLTSTIRMNNGVNPTEPFIVFAGVNSALDSDLPGATFNSGPNSQAFRIVPSPNGTFTINGVQFTWNNTQSLAAIRTMINTTNWAALGKPNVAMAFNNATQTLTLFSSNPPTPIQIVDNTGNFTVFTGLNGNTSLGNLASGLSNQITTNVSGQQLLTSQASNSLAQLNAAQANIAGVSTGNTSSGMPIPGVAIATIQQQAVQEMITYNALLQVLEVIDDMYDDLVGIINSSTPSGSFQNQSAPV